MKGLITAAAAMAMASAPVAFAADASRVSAPVTEESSLRGRSAVPLIVLLAILGGALWLLLEDDDDDNDPASA